MILDKNNKPIKKFEPEPEDEKPQVKKPSLKRRAIKALVLLGLALGLVITAVYYTDYFFDRNTINWQTPIKIQTPVYLTPRTQAEAKQVEVVPTAKAEAPVAPAVEVKPAQPNMDKLLAIIYQLESSSGKNDGCKTKGMFNGFGYAQSTHTWNCFSTFAEVEGKVQAWFEKRIPTMGLSTAICYYNTGHKIADCPYYQNYLKINAKSE